MAAILIFSFTADSFHFLTPFLHFLRPASFVLLPPSPLLPKIPSIASPSPEPADGLPWPSALRPDRRSRGAEPRNQELELEEEKEASSGGSTTSTTPRLHGGFLTSQGMSTGCNGSDISFLSPKSFSFLLRISLFGWHWIGPVPSLVLPLLGSYSGSLGAWVMIGSFYRSSAVAVRLFFQDWLDWIPFLGSGESGLIDRIFSRERLECKVWIIRCSFPPI